MMIVRYGMGLGLLLILSLSAPLWAQSCSNFEDRRLLTVAESILAIAEQLDSASGQRLESFALQSQDLREGIDLRDPELLAVTCRMLQQFPSLEVALADAQERVSDPRFQQWFASVSTLESGGARSYSCLTDAQYQGARSVLSVLRIAIYFVQGICDGFSCIQGACKAPCVPLGVLGIVLPPFELALTIDGLFCSTQHADEMKALCPVFGDNVCNVGRGADLTLLEIESLVTSEILPDLTGLGEDAATGETLEATQTLLADRVERTRDQLLDLETLVLDDAERRVDFQTDLRSIDIEAALSRAGDTAPIDLQLPASVGGRLETVREVVADAIANSIEAGLEIGQALSLLSDADDQLNQGLYTEAFDAYRSAYRELVQ